jgi:hypothetical protein
VRLATTGRTLEPWLSIDETALKAKVEAGLAALATAGRQHVTMTPKASTLTPAQTGRAFDGTAAIAFLIAPKAGPMRRTSWWWGRTARPNRRSASATPHGQAPGGADDAGSSSRAARTSGHQGGADLDPHRDRRTGRRGRRGRDRDLEALAPVAKAVKVPAISRPT